MDSFILIGGKSSRLGRDKAFVEVAGEALVSRAIRTVEAALPGSRISLSAGSETQFPAHLLFGLSRPIVFDLHPGFGAWSALETALGYARGEWIFVFACDLPNVSSDLIRLLVSRRSDEIDAVVPRQADGRLQPLCAFYRVKTVTSMLAKTFTGSCSPPPLNGIFDELRTRVVEFAELSHLANADALFANVNTPDDLDVAISRGG